MKRTTAIIITIVLIMAGTIIIQGFQNPPGGGKSLMTTAISEPVEEREGSEMAKTADRQVVNGNTYMLMDSEAREAISNEEAAREAVASDVSDLKTALGGLTEDAEPTIFQKDSISGTYYKSYNYILPSGEYVISADDFTSDGSVSGLITFNYRDLQSESVLLPFGENVSANFHLKREAFEIYVFADSTGTTSQGKDFSITNFKIKAVSIREEIDNLKTEIQNVNDVLNCLNLFNGVAHNNVPKTTVGAKYGEETELDSYFYTDLIPVVREKPLYVFSGMYFSGANYIYFYDKDKRYLGSYPDLPDAGFDTFPDGAEYFCVATNDSRMNKLVISYVFPVEYAKPRTLQPILKGYLEEKYIRYDRAQIANGFSNENKLFPFTYNADIVSVYPMPVPESGNLRCVTTTKYIAVEYYTEALDHISGETVEYESKQLTIPAGAKVVCAYMGRCEPSDYYFVEGTEDLDHYPTYEETETNGIISLASNLFEKRILFIGDSITAGSYYNGGWSKIVRDRTGAFVNNRGHDGFTVGKLENRTDNLIDRLDETTGEYDLIVLSGGYNDLTTYPRAEIGTINPIPYNDDSAYDPYTFAGGIETYIRLARSKWPNAKIVYVLTMRRVWQNATTSSEQLTYWDIIRTACEKWSIPYLDLSRTSMLIGDGINGASDPITHEYYHNDDGTHPNQNGYEYTAPQIIHFLEQYVD